MSLVNISISRVIDVLLQTCKLMNDTIPIADLERMNEVMPEGYQFNAVPPQCTPYVHQHSKAVAELHPVALVDVASSMVETQPALRGPRILRQDRDNNGKIKWLELTLADVHGDLRDIRRTLTERLDIHTDKHNATAEKLTQFEARFDEYNKRVNELFEQSRLINKCVNEVCDRLDGQGAGLIKLHEFQIDATKWNDDQTARLDTVESALQMHWAKIEQLNESTASAERVDAIKEQVDSLQMFEKVATSCNQSIINRLQDVEQSIEKLSLQLNTFQHHTANDLAGLARFMKQPTEDGEPVCPQPESSHSLRDTIKKMKKFIDESVEYWGNQASTPLAVDRHNAYCRAQTLMNDLDNQLDIK